MADLSQSTIPQLWARMWRIRLACWAMRVVRVFADLAERIMPEDLMRRP